MRWALVAIVLLCAQGSVDHWRLLHPAPAAPRLIVKLVPVGR